MPLERCRFPSAFPRFLFTWPNSRISVMPNLKPLPAEPRVHAEWKRCRVGLDYHIGVDHHHYSVPHRFARREVEARVTARTVEIFLGGERIAVHMRIHGKRLLRQPWWRLFFFSLSYSCFAAVI